MLRLRWDLPAPSIGTVPLRRPPHTSVVSEAAPDHRLTRRQVHRLPLRVPQPPPSPSPPRGSARRPCLRLPGVAGALPPPHARLDRGLPPVRSVHGSGSQRDLALIGFSVRRASGDRKGCRRRRARAGNRSTGRLVGVEVSAPPSALTGSGLSVATGARAREEDGRGRRRRAWWQRERGGAWEGDGRRKPEEPDSRCCATREELVEEGVAVQEIDGLEFRRPGVEEKAPSLRMESGLRERGDAVRRRD